MKREMLRFRNVTVKEDQIIYLNDMSFYVFQDEVYGFHFFNELGSYALVETLKKNTTIEYGSVYFEEKLVNNHLYSDGSENSVMVLRRQLPIVGGLTVMDNLFILQPDYKSPVISNRQMEKLEKRMEELTKEIEVNISPFDMVEELSLFHQTVTALLSGIISGIKLVVCEHLSNFLSTHELVEFHKIIRIYKKKGISFIYLGAHHEETFQICDRVSLVQNGGIIKKLEKEDMKDRIMEKYVSLHDSSLCFSRPYENKDTLDNRNTALSFSSKNKGPMIDVELKVGEGECLVLLDADNTVFDSLVKEVMRLYGSDVAVVDENPVKTMMFPELSSWDNLLFTRGNKNPELWRAKRYRDSVARMYMEELGSIIEKENLFDLTRAEQYKIVYYRAAIQNPKAVFFRQPFAGADMVLRGEILELMRMILDRGIGVVILAVSISDSLSVANRLQLIEGGRTIREYHRSKFEDIRKNRLNFLEKQKNK